ncbi:MAG: S9 family peptidase [Candidatus Sericytochromatia bacterium]|nr:S9 family peptidase [Candidatus Sericytochromatia bacterium]
MIPVLLCFGLGLPASGAEASRTSPLVRTYLGVRGHRAVTFSPDGRSLVFTSTVTGTAQLWTVPIQGGWPQPLTQEAEPVSEAIRLPGRYLTTVDEGGNERRRLAWLPLEGGALRTYAWASGSIQVPGPVTRDGRLLAYATNERDARRFDLHLLEPASGRSRRILEGDGTLRAATWLKDGELLVYHQARTPTDEDFHLLDLRSRMVRPLTERPGAAIYRGVHRAANGNLWLVSDEGREFAGLATLDPARPGLRFLGPDGPETVSDLVLSEDGTQAAWIRNLEGWSELWVSATDAPKPRRIESLPAGVLGGPVWSADGKRLAITLSTPVSPPDAWLVDPATGVSRRVTHAALGGLRTDLFVRPERVLVPSFDKRAVPAWRYRPPGLKPGQRAPWLVIVHGGPEGEERPSFSAAIQLHLARGWGVLAPNIRGSTGMGRSWSHLDDGRKRPDALADMAALATWLRRQPDVDARRVVVTGGSYGGYVTMACLAFQPDLWAGGVSSVGMSSLVTFLERTGPWRRALREAEYGSLERDRDFLVHWSPLTHVDRIRAPLFLIQGVQDPRVPVGEARQMAEALRLRDRQVRLLEFEDEGHGLGKFSNRVTALDQTLQFLDALAH